MPSEGRKLLATTIEPKLLIALIPGYLMLYFMSHGVLAMCLRAMSSVPPACTAVEAAPAVPFPADPEIPVKEVGVATKTRTQTSGPTQWGADAHWLAADPQLLDKEISSGPPFRISLNQ